MLSEKSVLSLDVHQAISDPSCFVFYDRFADLSFPQKVLPERPYFKEYLARTIPMWSQDRETLICRQLEARHE